MKNLFLAASLFFTMGFISSVFGQTIASTSTKFIYCELVGTQKILSTKITVSVDYGEEKSFFQDTRMKDEQTGKVQAFNSMVDALNYMGNDGWEFVQAYVVTSGQNNVYRWLLKKEK